MMSSDRSSGSNRFTRLLQHAQRELERAEARKPGAGAAAPAAALPERPTERGVVGGSLDRLVRGTIACDALATLAAHLLQLEPALVRHPSRSMMDPPHTAPCTHIRCAGPAPDRD